MGGIASSTGGFSTGNADFKTTGSGNIITTGSGNIRTQGTGQIVSATDITAAGSIQIDNSGTFGGPVTISDASAIATARRLEEGSGRRLAATGALTVAGGVAIGKGLHVTGASAFAGILFDVAADCAAADAAGKATISVSGSTVFLCLGTGSDAKIQLSN